MALPMRPVLTVVKRFIWLSRKYSHLKNGSVRVRFAPSPTGDMHLGGLRTALYNYLFAKSKSGTFILRIEDTDQTRAIPGATEGLLSVLQWAQLHPDEGPGIGGDHGPYIQSQRKELYKEYAERLLKSGHAYRCFCTQKRLDLLRREQIRQGETTGYDNKCRHLSESEVKEKLEQNVPHVIRFKYEPLREPCTDLIHGLTNTKLVGEKVEGDFVIIKSDLYPTYHFANVVDDHLMNISHVLRGEEWSISTPKHLQMYEAFGWEAPHYGHLPLILNSDGTKLSKRQDDIKVDIFRKKHTDPNALLNYLTTSNGGFTESTEGKTLSEMVETFSIDLVTKHSTRLQPDRLRQISKTHLKRRFDENSDAVLRKARQILEKTYGNRIVARTLIYGTPKANRVDPDETATTTGSTLFANTSNYVTMRILHNDTQVLEKNYIERTLTWGLKERIFELNDLVSESMEFIWLPPSEETVFAFCADFPDYEATVAEVADLVGQMETLAEEEGLKSVLMKCCKERKFKAKTFFSILRNSLSGLKEGPPISEMMVMLGKEETLRRLNRASILAVRSRSTGTDRSVKS